MKRTPEMATVKTGATTITYSLTMTDRDNCTYYGGQVESTLLPDEFIAWAKKEFDKGADWRSTVYCRFYSMTSPEWQRRAVAAERGLPASMVKRTIQVG